MWLARAYDYNMTAWQAYVTTIAVFKVQFSLYDNDFRVPFGMNEHLFIFFKRLRIAIAL